MELSFFLVAFRYLSERTPPSIDEGATIIIKIPEGLLKIACLGMKILVSIIHWKVEGGE
jgi:hypothetical protein